MSSGKTNTAPSTFAVLRDIRLVALAVLVGISAAFAGGLLLGWASSGRPSTLSQAIQQADTGALPAGSPSPAPQKAPPSSPPPPPAPPAALYNLAFFGIVSSVSGNQLGVETKAGQVGVGLTAGTHFATVDLAQSNRSKLIDGKLILIVPESSIQGTAESTAGTVVLLPE